MPSVVSNSTPIIALAKTGRIGVMKSLYGEVLIPEAVFHEVTAKDDVAARAIASGADWLIARSAPKPDTASLLRTRLHAGEVETIMLAREVGADLVVIDDAAAKKTARYLGLPVAGTLGVLVAAKRAGLVDDVGSAIEDLRCIGFYVSDDIAAMAKAAAGE